jgi:hypothetical protein
MSADCFRWEPIRAFGSAAEFERFRDLISRCVERACVERVPVDTRWKDANPLFEEWFRCAATGEVWRLLKPDPPSRGAFVPVDAGPGT